MTTDSNNSEAVALFDRRMSNACIFSPPEALDILQTGFDTLDECEEIDGVNCYSAVHILNAVASAIWLKFHDAGHTLQGSALMTHALKDKGWRAA